METNKLTCNKCGEKIPTEEESGAKYKIELINTIVNVCIRYLKSGKCETNRCKYRDVCEFKPIYMNKKLSTEETDKLKFKIKNSLFDIKVKNAQPYCGKGRNIYCMSCGIKESE